MNGERNAFDPRRVLELLEFRDPVADRPYPKRGDVLDDFVIEREIGRGGSAVVFEATQAPLDRRVALKVLSVPPSLDSDRDRDRFTSEIQTLGRLGHPGIVKIHAAGTVPGFRYLAMDYIDGPTLARVISGEGPDWLPTPGQPGWTELAHCVIRGIAAALAEAHAHGVLHRDVKPQNVLITKNREAVLVDFGLARHEDSSISWTTSFVGTPGFASPEQTRGDPLTPASDVFSLGATAFATFTARQPFAGTDRLAVFDKIRTIDVRWPPNIARDLRAVIDRCLEKSPSARYRDAAQVRDEFDRLARFEPVVAKPIGRLGRVVRYARRRPLRVLAGAAFVLLAAFATVLAWSATTRGGKIRAMEARSQLARAWSDVRDGRLREARDLLESLLDDPGCRIEAAGLLGDLWLSAGSAERARTSYEIAYGTPDPALADRIGREIAAATLTGRAPELDPQWPQAESPRDHSAMARLLQLRGDAEASLRSHDTAVALDPSCFLWRWHRAVELQALLHRRKAVEDLRTLNMSRPDDPRVVVRLCKLLPASDSLEKERLVRGALQQAPGHVGLTIRLSEALAEQGRPKEALGVVERLFAEHPDDPRVRAHYAWRLVEAKRFDAAGSVLRTGLERHPDDPDLLRTQAHAFWNRKNGDGLERVANRLRRSERLRDRSAGLYFLALAHALRGNSKAQVEVLSRLVDLDPEFATAYAQLGKALMELGKLDEARKQLDKGLRLDGQDKYLRIMSGFVDGKLGRKWNAIQEFTIADSIDPDGNAFSARYLCVPMAYIWLDLDMPQAAIHWAKKGTEHDPKSIHAWICLAISQLAADDAAAAIVTYRKALALHPVPALRVDYAEALGLAHQEALALREYARARREDARLAKAYFGAAAIRLSSKDEKIRNPSLAAELYKRAVELQPAPALRADYAEALHLSGQDELALRELEKARAEDDKLPTTYCGEALIRLDSKDPELRDPQQALSLMRRAIELAPAVTEYRTYLKRAEAAVAEQRRAVGR